MACLANVHSWIISYRLINSRCLKTLYICKRMKAYLLLNHRATHNNINCIRLLNISSPDIMDSFTERLVQEKLQKWDSIKMQKNRYAQSDTSTIKLHAYNVKEIPIDLEESTSRDMLIATTDNELDSIIKGVNERDDILAILRTCVEHKCYPSSKLILELASNFAKSGDKIGIEALQTLCKVGNEVEYFNQGEYKHFMAEATWVRGNLESSLEQFLNVYKHNHTLREKVRSMVTFLIEDVITKRGEAQLIVITNYAKILATEYNDLYFLSFIWQYCFMSEWFSDQQVATALLEQYEGLSEAIIARIPVVTMTSIRNHKVDNIQRLLEVLLRFGIKQEYGQVLRVYFDYKYNQGDLQACSAIIRSSLELNVALTANQHKRFLSLLLDQQHGNVYKQISKPPPVTQFQFKF